MYCRFRYASLRDEGRTMAMVTSRRRYLHTSFNPDPSKIAVLSEDRRVDLAISLLADYCIFVAALYEYMFCPVFGSDCLSN